MSSVRGRDARRAGPPAAQPPGPPPVPPVLLRPPPVRHAAFRGRGHPGGQAGAEDDLRLLQEDRSFRRMRHKGMVYSNSIFVYCI